MNIDDDERPKVPKRGSKRKCGFSFCYEFHNPDFFAKLLPGKEKLVGQETFLRALEYTSKKLGKGACSGEIIAGVEPIEDTLRAIDYITGLGAFPTVCIFRPTIGTDMEHWPPPRYFEIATDAAGFEARAADRLPSGLPNRARIKVFDSRPGHTLIFFYKRSLVPYSRDRYSYGGVDLRHGELNSREIAEWLAFVSSGFHPEKRPTNLRRAFPYEIPE